VNERSDAHSKASGYRQYLLLAMLLAMMAYFGGEWVLDNLIEGPIEAAQRKTDSLRGRIKRLETGLAKIRAAGKLLERWENQSLPSDTEVARSLYQAWLVELVDDVGFGNPSVNSSEPLNRKGLFYALSFSVRGRGTLEQLTTFLFTFYETDLLHQVRSVNITPTSQQDMLDLSIAIEALVLRNAGRASSRDPETVFEEFRQRTWRRSDRLAFDRLEDYDPIVRRNLFETGAGGAIDPTDSTYLTSINIVNGVPEAWFTVRTTDEVMKLKPGEVFQIGSLVGRIAEIYGQDVIIESDDGERWLLTLGDKITDAHALPPEF